jgi:FkbM family methyltransferase
MVRVINSNYGDMSTEIYVYDSGECVSDHMVATSNFFEIQFLDYINTNYKTQKSILDIGANIGNHSLFFAKFLNCDKVYSFEPVQSNIDLLKKNMENFKDKSMIYELALSNKEGTMPLYNSQNGNNGGFSLHSYSNGSSFLVKDSVDVITLDSLNLSNISMIKIDVENHENEVLQGGKQTILNNKPIIFIENLYHGYPNVCPNPNPHQEIFDELGYYKKESNILGSYMDLWVPK